ncbi:unnamed protein product [Trichobilharzia regenti]|nr:unnamed protein product [Trichobilharzia regenti]
MDMHDCPLEGTINGINTMDVIIPFATNKSLKCGLIPSELESQLNGSWKAKILTKNTQLVSLSYKDNQVYIQPPSESKTYNRNGTLNGVDNSDIHISKGSSNRFSCGLLPRDIEDNLNAYWIGKILSKSVVSSSNSNNDLILMVTHNRKVIIQPPKGKLIYDLTGYVQINCQLKSVYGNKIIIDFNKTITIHGKIFECLICLKDVDYSLSAAFTAVSTANCMLCQTTLGEVLLLTSDTRFAISSLNKYSVSRSSWGRNCFADVIFLRPFSRKHKRARTRA